jgi:hypothetical protein
MNVFMVKYSLTRSQWYVIGSVTEFKHSDTRDTEAQRYGSRTTSVKNLFPSSHLLYERPNRIATWPVFYPAFSLITVPVATDPRIFSNGPILATSATPPVCHVQKEPHEWHDHLTDANVVPFLKRQANIFTVETFS